MNRTNIQHGRCALVRVILAAAMGACAAQSSLSEQPQPGSDVAAAIAQVEQEHPAQSKDLAGALELLAKRMVEEKRFADARLALERLLPIERVIYGPDHLEVANTLYSLAAMHLATGTPEAAVPLLTRSLEIREKRLGSEHLDVASTLNDLAALHQNLQQPALALPLYERSLAVRERLLGPTHLDVATSLGNVAWIRQVLGQRDEAVSLYQRSLSIREQQLGPQHLDVASSLSSLGWLREVMGQHVEALSLYERCLAIREQKLGPTHLDVASSLGDIASLLQSMGKHVQALPLYERSLAIREQQLGPLDLDVASSLNSLAWLRQEMGQYTDALPLYERSLAIREGKLGPWDLHVAESLGSLASLRNRMGQYAQALPLYERSLAIREKRLGPKHLDVAMSLSFLGWLRQDMGQYEKALLLFERSLSIREQLQGAQHLDVARSLSELAGLHMAMGRFAQAQHLYERSLTIQESQLEPANESIAKTLNNLAVLHKKMGHYSQALPLMERSLAIYQQVAVQQGVEIGVSLGNLASLRQDMGQYASAQQLYERSISLIEGQLGPEHPDVAAMLNNLATLHTKLGRHAQALNLLDRSLEIQEARLGSNHKDVANTLGNLASLHMDMGHYTQALSFGERSLTIREKLLGSEHESVGDSLNTLGVLQMQLGNDAQALVYLQRSLAIRERAIGPTHLSVAVTLGNLALLRANMRQYAQALQLQKRSRAIHETQLGASSSHLGTSLHNEALLLSEMGRKREAIALAQRSLAIEVSELGVEHVSVAYSLGLLASLHMSLGQYAEALPLAQRSIGIASASPAGREPLWYSSALLASLLERQAQHESAIFWNKLAINTLQGLRRDADPDGYWYASRFLSRRSWPFTQLADILVAQGRIPEAQEVLRLLKERELRDEILRGDGSTASELELTGVERAKFGEFYRLRDRLVELAAERQQLQAKRRGERTAVEEKRLAEISEDLFPKVVAANSAFFAALQTELNRAAPGPDALYASQRVQAALRTTIDELASRNGEPGARAVGLQYVVADDRLSIILTVPGGPPIARQIALKREDLNKRIDRITYGLQYLGVLEGEEGLMRQARALHALLIAPVLPDLKRAGAKTLMISATDVLRFVPFAVLHDGRNYLVQDYALALYNDAATRLSQPGKKNWRIAAFGLSEAVSTRLPALKGVPLELTAVVNGSGRGEQWLNRPFTREQLRDSLVGDYDVVHVASHFQLERGNPRASKLYLGDKSALSLEEFAINDFRFTGIDLVTLSACETAKGGGRTSYGQEMDSLSAQVQTQGAAAVLATLWKVADASTAQVMKRFYDNRLEGNMNKAEALRAAQLALLNGQDRPQGSNERNWKHPFYWAPFVLMGNWR